MTLLGYILSCSGFADVGPIRERIESYIRNQVLLRVTISPEGRVSVRGGSADTVLIAGQPKLFLLRVENASGGKPAVALQTRYSGGEHVPFQFELAGKGSEARLRGSPVDYLVFSITAEQAGRHEITLGLEAGQGSQDLGFRGEVPVLFTVKPTAHPSRREVQK